MTKLLIKTAAYGVLSGFFLIQLLLLLLPDHLQYGVISGQ
jgi:hypothetical protein